MCADECTIFQKRITYARLLIEVDITKPLQYTIKVEGENGNVVDQKVHYEWVPQFCQRCQKVGHICREQVEKKITQVVHKQWVKKEQLRTEPKLNTGEKQKEKMEDGWDQPKKVISPTIQVGNIHIPTNNGFQIIQEETILEEIQGGDLFPIHQT